MLPSEREELLITSVMILLRVAGVRDATGQALAYVYFEGHYPVNLALDHVFTKAPEITAQSLAIFLARIAICVAASLLFYFFFERYTQAVRRWLKGT